jgi:hypothetical protein
VNTKAAARRAARSPWLALLARAGFLSRALVYLVVAVLAASVVLGSRGERVDRKGAVEAIAEQPFGRVLLVALAAGFAGYALWRLGRAAFPPREDREHPGRRWTHLGSAIVYLGVFAGTVRFLTGTAGDTRAQADSTAAVMALPFGAALVGAAGLAVLASAGWSVRRALTKGYRDNLRRLPPKAAPWADTAAVGGLFARAVGHLLIGAFLLQAAWRHDPSESVGLDGALRAVAATAWGDALLGLLAVGYLARAAFSVFEARYRKGT